jgi:O-antigen ligase
MTATVYPAGLYSTAVRPNAFATVRRFDPTWLVTVYVTVLLIVPSPLQIGAFGAAGGPANMIALVALGWWICARLIPGGMAWGFSPIRWATIGFTMAMFAGFAAGATRPLTGIESNGADRTLMAMLGLAGVTLIAADGISTLDRLNTMVRRLVNVTAVFAAIGIAQFYTAIDVARLVHIPGLSPAVAPTDEFALQERGGLSRVVGTSSHPIEFGVVLAIVLPIALHLALTAADDERRVRWFTAIVIAFALPLSLARSAVLGVTVGLFMLWCGWASRRKTRALAIVAVYLVVMRLLVDGLLGTIRGMFTNMFNDPSYTGRTMDYASVGEMFGQKPWVGHGLGTFDPQTYFLLDNQYLGTLIETGLVGVVAMSLLFLVGLFTARSIYRMCRAAGLTDLGELGRALAASMLVVIVSFITFDALAFGMAAGVLFVLLGLIGAAWRVARVETSDLARPQPSANGERGVELAEVGPS